MKLRTINIHVYEIGDVVEIDLSKSNRRAKQLCTGVKRAVIIDAKIISYGAGIVYKVMTDGFKAIQLNADEENCITEYLGHIDFSTLTGEKKD